MLNFTFNGKAQRGEYWRVYLSWFGLTLLIGIIAFVTTIGSLNDLMHGESSIIGLLGGWFFIFLIIGLVAFVSCLAVTVRRCNDIGINPFWSLVTLAPYIGFGAVLIFGVLDSNQYPIVTINTRFRGDDSDLKSPSPSFSNEENQSPTIPTGTPDAMQISAKERGKLSIALNGEKFKKLNNKYVAGLIAIALSSIIFIKYSGFLNKSETTVDSLLDLSNIGLQIDYLENKFKLSPKKIRGENDIPIQFRNQTYPYREYEVDGCEIKIETKYGKNEVLSIAVRDKDSCAFKYTDPLSQRSSSLKDLSASKILSSENLMKDSIRFIVECMQCGNHMEPEYSILLPTNNANLSVQKRFKFYPSNYDAGIGLWSQNVISSINGFGPGYNPNRKDGIEFDIEVNCSKIYDNPAFSLWSQDASKPFAYEISRDKYIEFGYPAYCATR